MKKSILLTLAVALFGVILTNGEVKAQTTSYGYLLSTPTHVITDTATNTTPLVQTRAVSGWQDEVGVSYSFTKISGTISGSAVLYGSRDNTMWHPLDTFSVTNTASEQLFEWNSSGASKYAYYKVTTTLSSSNSGKVKSYILPRIKVQLQTNTIR